jgi:hypothetical protein
MSAALLVDPILGVSMSRTWIRAVIVLTAISLVGIRNAYGEGDTPLVSANAGFISTTTGGQTSLQPILNPVVVAPIGSKLLVEGSYEFQGFVARPTPDSPFDAQYFGTLWYLQMDYIVNRHLTFVAGRFLTPFNIYNERLSPIWINPLQNAPLIFGIGTRTSGSSDGAMVRGVVAAHPGWEWNYTAFFSAGSSVNQFESGRAFGTRSGVFFPKIRLEVGASYERFLQNLHNNSAGAYLSWQPNRVPIDIKAEYAHSPQGSGYWLEAGYQFKQSNPLGPWMHNLIGIVRVQQFFKGIPEPGDALLNANAQVAECGFNYFLPKTVRINASYGRQFSDAGNFNQWTFGVTKRFTFPAIPARNK